MVFNILLEVKKKLDIESIEKGNYDFEFKKVLLSLFE